MLGEAAEKLGFKGRGVGGESADAGGAKEEEHVPTVVAALKNRAAESRSPYVSCAVAVNVEVEGRDAADWIGAWAYE